MDAYFYISKIFTPFVVPSNFFIFLLVIFFYLGIYKNKFFFKKLFNYFFICFLLLATLPIGKNLTYFFLEKDYVNAKVQNDIDYIFVPAGGSDRLLKALEIKNNNNNKNLKIIYSTGRPYLDINKSNDAELEFANNLVSNSKIKKEDFIFLQEARNTYENFFKLNEYLSNNDKKNSKILLVTHGYHLKRSLMLASKYNLQIYPFGSSFFSLSNTSGVINHYQRISVVDNLKGFDVFIKELISTFVSYFL